MNNNFEYPRDFKGIFIPKEVWLDDELGAVDKFILAELDSLDVEGSEGCYASNEYLANFCKCSVTKVSTSISKLIGLGYVRLAKSDGRKRYLKVSLSKFESQTNKKRKSPSQKMKQSNIPSNIPSTIDDNINNIPTDYNNSIPYDNNSKEETFQGKGSGRDFFPEEKQPEVKPKKKTRKQLLADSEDMVKRFTKIIGNMDIAEDEFEILGNGFCHYLEKYTEKTGKIHPCYENRELRHIANVLTEIQDEEYHHFGSITTQYENCLNKMIDTHFDVKKSRKGTDYHMAHFANKEYLTKLAQRCAEY